MNIKRGAWGGGLLAVGILLGFMAGRASSGIQKVSGPRFFEYAATKPINSASAFALVGVERGRVYGEQWDARRPLRGPWYQRQDAHGPRCVSAARRPLVGRVHPQG